MARRIDQHNLKLMKYKGAAYHSNILNSFDSLSNIIASGRSDNGSQLTFNADSPVIFDTFP